MLFGIIVLLVFLTIIGISVADAKMNSEEGEEPDIVESDWWDQ